MAQAVHFDVKLVSTLRNSIFHAEVCVVVRTDADDVEWRAPWAACPLHSPRISDLARPRWCSPPQHTAPYHS